MRAARVVSPGRVEVVDTEQPTVGPGEVLVRVTAASVCHSDVMLRTAPPVLQMTLPLTLGHEVAGTVEAVSPDVEGWEPGHAVAVYPLTGCGRCIACERGDVNICRRGFTSIGVHRDGGLAELLAVPAANLVDATGLAPSDAAALTDAGLTSFHAVRTALQHQPKARVVAVIGVGGLGHLAIQELTALSTAEVIAIDLKQTSLDLALSLGATSVFLSHPGTAEAVIDKLGGREVDAFIDFVGNQATLDLAAATIAPGGTVVVVGLGGGALPVQAALGGPVPSDVDVQLVSVGSRDDLEGVIRLARSGDLQIEIETVGLEQAPAAIDRLEHGDVIGRLVVVPGLPQLPDA
ncbi:MAG: alcohol dehydrogenase catalytic domain-containing protein [Aeromicrobium sp.]